MGSPRVSWAADWRMRAELCATGAPCACLAPRGCGAITPQPDTARLPPNAFGTYSRRRHRRDQRVGLGIRQPRPHAQRSGRRGAGGRGRRLPRGRTVEQPALGFHVAADKDADAPGADRGAGGARHRTGRTVAGRRGPAALRRRRADRRQRPGRDGRPDAASLYAAAAGDPRPSRQPALPARRRTSRRSTPPARRSRTRAAVSIAEFPL